MSPTRIGAPHVVFRLRIELIRRVERAVVNRKLKVRRQPADARLEPHLAVVVLRRAPLRSGRTGRLPNDAGGRPANAERIDGAVEPVVERPDEAARLATQRTAAAEVRREHGLLVGGAIAVRVGEAPQLVAVVLERQDRVRADRQDEAREQQLVHEHAVVLVDAVVVSILMDGNPTDGLQQVLSVGRLFVSSQLDDEHASVAVEGNLSRVVDVGIGEDGLDAVARRQPEPLRLLRGWQRRERRLRGQIRVGVERIVGPRRDTRAPAGLLAGVERVHRRRTRLRRARAHRRRRG